MTSKKAYNYLLGLLESGGDMRWSLVKESMDKFKELIDQQNQPTLDECIKKWEEAGFEVRENTDYNLLFRHHKDDNVVEIFKKDLSYMYYPYFDDGTILSIPYNLHNLIHKTLKALEVEE